MNLDCQASVPRALQALCLTASLPPSSLPMKMNAAHPTVHYSQRCVKLTVHSYPILSYPIQTEWDSKKSLGKPLGSRRVAHGIEGGSLCKGQGGPRGMATIHVIDTHFKNVACWACVLQQADQGPRLKPWTLHECARWPTLAKSCNTASGTLERV